MTVDYAFLDAIIASSRTTVQQDLVVSEVMVSGIVTLDYRDNELTKTLFVDDDITTILIIPPTLRIAKTSIMFKLFLQFDDPNPPYTIGSWDGIAGYFGAAPAPSTANGARDVLVMTYDNGIYGGVWGMFSQGAPV